MTTATAMRIWRGLDEVPCGFGPCVVTIGVFDGVHRGHTRLIERAVEVGRRHGVPTVLITFDPHPARVVGPPRDTSALSTPERRAELAGELGVDAVLVLSFTPELARTPPEAFVRSVLVRGLQASAVVVGSNFRFGEGGAGTVELLRALGRRFGFAAEGVDLLRTEQVRCSSTHVRSCLSSGDTAAAARALGRPHRVEGRLAG
ncbi:MAG: adenylyltransferase/cytidyltransferase family protein, partial [Actinomycetota bacterium]|nr:adenylyltransferase/cytidyltransferase family protein [Actinomycetota bacterium]